MPRNEGYTYPRYPNYKTQKRIRIPQTPDRPLKIDPRSLIRKERDPMWLVLHRHGPHREMVGEDPLEARAMPRSLIRGTLPERIIYMYLVRNMHMVDGVEFEFQTSLQGGRSELGGIVADFLFRQMRIVINPLGPTHTQFIREAKDREQTLALALMGYQVFMIEENDVYNEFTLEAFMRRVFGLEHVGGSAQQYYSDEQEPSVPGDDPGLITGEDYATLYTRVCQIEETAHDYFG